MGDDPSVQEQRTNGEQASMDRLDFRYAPIWADSLVPSGTEKRVIEFGILDFAAAHEQASHRLAIFP